jgi:hypothetical protein
MNDSRIDYLKNKITELEAELKSYIDSNNSIDDDNYISKSINELGFKVYTPKHKGE